MHWRYCKINQYDLNGKYIKSFPTSIKASNEVFTYHRCIEKACRGLLSTVAGFQWRRLPKDAPNTNIEPFVKKRGTNIKKPVVAICLATKIRTEYSSTLECAKALHIDPKNIRETIKGNQKQSSGYTFEEK